MVLVKFHTKTIRVIFSIHRFEDIDKISTKRTNAYDVTVYVLIPDTELPTPTAIDCFLSIPQTPYQRRKTLQYNPGKGYCYLD